mmetsp:Transcript_1855/g.4913  ORF Transcript_1855/g.4913 Transcript_1855/m.4913 type:complete len:210 (-) Transcript_1855:91-720(-)
MNDHVPVALSVLYRGTFHTNVMGHRTKVYFRIRDNYEVKASFSCQGSKYEFVMKKWSETSADVTRAVSTFNQFALLVDQRFGEQAAFGTLRTETLQDGSISQSVQRNREQIINILKYATVSVFICTEEILGQHHRCVLDYAIFHRERGKQATFEEYIHLVACHCLVYSNFHAPNMTYPLVDYCSDEQQFDAALLLSIDASDGDETNELV